MAISKIRLNGVTKMDVTGTTATVSDVASGKVFTQVDGTTGTGTASGGGGGNEPALEPPLKDVVFIDYDGEVVAQYTKAEFLALSAMPSNPSHTGLTARGGIGRSPMHRRSYSPMMLYVSVRCIKQQMEKREFISL